MLNTDISKELKIQIETNQAQLKNAIRNHQILINKLKHGSSQFGLNKEVQSNVEEAQQQIIIIGLEQKGLVDKLRREYKSFQRNVKTTTVKNGLEERRFNLSNALNRARKQNIITRPQSVVPPAATTTSVQSASPSEESEVQSGPSTPEPTVVNPVNPQDVTQSEFLTYFGLATHEVFKEIQNKRAERKRRRTANPQFLYTRGWDISKRKRNMYLASNISPPNTRQSAKRRGPSPSFKPSRPTSPVEQKKTSPPGLTVERINQLRLNSDTKACIECRLETDLLNCDICTNGFHVACHNRPLVQPPKQCPRCYKELKIGECTGGNIPGYELIEKMELKEKLLEKNKELLAELTQLQDKHSKLTISIKSNEAARAEKNTTQTTTEENIQRLLTFITNIKEGPPVQLGGVDISVS